MVTTPINVAMAAELSSKVHPATDCSGFEDVTREACGNFEVIDTCTYAARSLGGSENLGSMGCDCYEDTSGFISSGRVIVRD